MIKVLLADDHEIITDGLKSILKNEDNIEVVATVSNGRDAVNYIEKIRWTLQFWTLTCQ